MNAILEMSRELAMDLKAVGAVNDDSLRRIQFLCSQESLLTEATSSLQEMTRSFPSLNRSVDRLGGAL